MSIQTGDVVAQASRLPFFIVGPTAVAKSEIAAEVARACGGEVVSADAFQIYHGLDVLTAKPDAETLRVVPHHLIGSVRLDEEMNAERFRRAATRAIESIPRPFVVGGTGLYVRALTDGLSPLPAANPQVRAHLEQCTARELFVRLQMLDPAGAQTIDRHNKRRLVRALEICLLTRRPASELRSGNKESDARGVVLFRDRDELNERIRKRVEAMFANGVVDEVRAVSAISATAEKAIGFREIKALIAGEISEAECREKVTQATRRYAKRQLTWFRHQTNFEPLNLTGKSSAESIELIARKARLFFATTND
ncbi:MAG: tRNA (adenosine(37)-N6)-dimethylallyltransferase MiaA [Chthoniobacterales bacterium]